MQINDKNGIVKITLTQAESRRLRDAVYIARAAARNLGASDANLCEKLLVGAAGLLELADKCTAAKSVGKLDEQDAEQPEVPLGRN